MSETPTSSPDLLSRSLSSLSGLRDAVNKEFPGAQLRLHQFNDSITTAVMALEYLFDEAERMPEAGYRKTPEQKAQDAADQQRVIDDLRKKGVSV